MDEIRQFKTAINLTEFAASYGYALDKRETSKSSASMRHADGDKIIISKSVSGDWIYFSVRDSGDNGSIIDFLQRRRGGSLGEVRKTLRQWAGTSRPIVPVENYTPDLIPMNKDRTAAVMSWEQAGFQATVPYLEGRGLNADLLQSERFVRRFKIDRRRNVLFPHYDKNGLCGYELKNQNFTGFSPGGIKGLWYSLCLTNDKTLVFTESAIDGISYHALNPTPCTRYMSTGGSMNPQQPALIRAAMEKMPRGGSVVLAFDNDEGGEKLVDEVKTFLPSWLTLSRPLPPIGKDWNETLKKRLGLD